jgi:hypothetical protein
MTAALTLSGCFANPFDQLTDRIGSEIAKGGAEKLVEGMTGGGLEIAPGSLPDDFPAEVPVVDGEIQSSMSMLIEDTKAWNVTIKTGDANAALATARKELVAAGFEESLWNDGKVMAMGMFSKGDFRVNISAMFADDEDPIINYQVFDGIDGG